MPQTGAEPAAQMLEVRRTGNAFEAEQEEGDPEGQEGREQDARQSEGRDPRIKE